MMDLATAVSVLRDYESSARFKEPSNSKKGNVSGEQI